MRLFVAPSRLAAGAVTIDGDEHHYVMRVRRARVGDAVELVDGAGHRAAAVIRSIGADTTVLEVAAIEPVCATPPWMRVLIPAIKGDRMDVCIEKLVEVGADELIVWPAARAVVKLEAAKREARAAKYRAAAIAAARQSGRAAVPAVRIADDLADAIGPRTAGFVLDPAADAPLAVASPVPAVITIASGPEGGLAPAELDALLAAGFTAASLGPRILRAETAPVVAVALIRAATNS
jgi:16S rRNA (uracil1498-N3)-methyltransferase